MKSEKVLLKELQDMAKLTAAKHLKWEIKVSTTEYKEEKEKPLVEEDGITWSVDECYVSYHCQYKGQEFLMITYEMIHSSGDKKKTTNLIFLPPLGIRYFDLHTLLPYVVQTDQMLTYDVHMLWNLILELKKSNPELVAMDAEERDFSIEED